MQKSVYDIDRKIPEDLVAESTNWYFHAHKLRVKSQAHSTGGQMDEFEVFDKYHSRSVKEIFVTIQRRGNFSLNRAAFQALGSPQFIELLFNRAKHLIGFRPTDSANGRAIPIRKQGSSDSYMIAGLTFTKEYEIDTSVARRYTAKMQDHMLVVDLKSLSTDATGPRLRNTGLHKRQEELFSQLGQQIDAQDAVSNSDEVEQSQPSIIPEVSATASKDIDNVLANALMQLGIDQKRMIAEYLLRDANRDTKEAE